MALSELDRSVVEEAMRGDDGLPAIDLARNLTDPWYRVRMKPDAMIRMVADNYGFTVSRGRSGGWHFSRGPITVTTGCTPATDGAWKMLVYSLRMATA